MTEAQARYSLNKLKQRYILLRSIEIIFLSSAIAVFAFAVAGLLTSSYKIFIAGIFGVVTAIAMVIHLQLLKLGNDFFTSYLNQSFLQFNESADLLLFNNDELSVLQQIQKAKTLEKFDQVFPEIKLPHRIVQSVIFFAGSVVLYFSLSAFTPSHRSEKNKIHFTEIRTDNNPTSIFIKSLSVHISPPEYTNQKSFESADFNLKFPEGSSVKWVATFSAPPEDVRIFFSGRDSVKVSSVNSIDYLFEKIISESGFYQLQWRDKNKTYRSDFYKIGTIKDQSPKILIKDLNQFTRLKYTDQLAVQLKSDLSDDYGLMDAQIVATVSKGSGEGVKFREEKLRFESPIRISGKKIEAIRMLNLKKLGLEPSDELYFYIEATDNKTPVPNHSRTETFFIAIQDTSREISSVDSGLGVDLMPEYFRSQRQIIIDTEKLLRDKKNISKLQFNSTSNELGYDQKVLRLRYGQFLGEEDEAGIGQHAEEHQGEKEQDPTKQYGHQHDTKNEHNLVDQKNQKDEHAHENKNENEKEDPLKDFVHQHDNTEEATFFIQSLKAKLKAAITQMWDAELYLRLYQPEKSLPYQYKALNLLKEISSDSRIFVHRSGFDPPPLKEDKRLSADLSEIKTSTDLRKLEKRNKLPGIRSALVALEKMIAKNSVTVSAENKELFHAAGQELSALAAEQPVVFLQGLSLLKFLTENSTKISQRDLLELRAILFKAVPQEISSPAQQQIGTHALNKRFLKTLEQRKHE